MLTSVAGHHKQEYDSYPDLAVSAPGRMHILGEHTSFAKGRALTAAIDRRIYMAVSTRKDASLRFFSAKTNERKRATLQNLKYKREDRWSNYIKAAAAAFMLEGFPVKGMNITILSDVPAENKLDVGGILIALTAILLREIYAPRLSDAKLISMISAASKDFLKTNETLEDTLICLYAKENSFLLTNYETRKYETIPFPFSGVSIILTDARISYNAPMNELPARVKECVKAFEILKERYPHTQLRDYTQADLTEASDALPESVRRKALCIITEIQRACDAADALKKSDLPALSRVINHSHKALRDLYEISCPEIDWLVKRAQELDTNNAARITGLGSGGCTYSIIKNSTLEAYKQKLDEYERIFGFHPLVHVVKPAGGARVYGGAEITKANENFINE